MIGARLGKWIIVKELGRGGMGRVYLAHQEDGGRKAAIKILGAELAQEPGFLERFQREILVLSELNHPNIVRLYDTGTKDGSHYYAMEYVEGEDFEQLLQKHGKLPWKEVLDAAIQVCPALKHAHDRGIIHRDIKPPNLLRTPEGVVKLTDFGIAKVFAGRHLTNTGGVVGTAEYLSPEQASGKQATKRSDLYSFGVVLYTLLTGRTPFDGHSTVEILHKHLYSQFSRPIRLIPEIPHELDEVVCQLLEKDPSDRPADALVLQRQLDSIRRKLDRKAQFTVAANPSDRTVAENRDADPVESNPGLPTLMGRMMRRELEEENRRSPFGQWLNRPAVLLPLFLLCVGVIIWRFWPARAEPAEILFQQGAQLMASELPADWDKAWNDFLEPLNRKYPDHPYRKEVDNYRQQIDDMAILRRAVHRAPAGGPISEAQRFYQRGLRLCQDGDVEAARQTWRHVAAAFRKMESEQRWVRLCQEGVRQLDERAPPDQDRTKGLRDIRDRLSAGDKESKSALDALRSLYQDDPAALEVLNQENRSKDR